MKFYETKEDVPINLYNFYMNVWLPISAVVIFFISLNIALGRDPIWYRSAVFASGVMQAVLNSILIIGMRKWKPHVMALVTAELALFCADYLIGFTFVMVRNPALLLEVLVPGIIGLALQIIVFLYFYKRKLLYDGIPYKPALRNVVHPDKLKNSISE
jgi:hypothetical protein